MGRLLTRLTAHTGKEKEENEVRVEIEKKTDKENKT